MGIRLKESRQHPTTRFRPGWLAGLAAVVLVAAAGGALSWHVSSTVHGDTGNPLGELLGSFGPAALFASGKGMILPLTGMPPALEAFLTGQSASFDPAALPDAYAGPHIFGSYADTFTLTHWLLFYSVGWTWRLLGITVGALHILAGCLGAFTAAALYLLFRLGMGRLFAGLGALFTMLLPPFLLVEPSLRDFSKAPFFFLFLAVTGMLLSRRRGRGALFAFAAAFGLLLGTGYGFRQDLLICLPVVPVLLLAAPLRPGYHAFSRGISILVLLTVFGLTAAPVIRGMKQESGSVTTHTLFQGLSREAEQTMHFGGASYDLLLTTSDPETHAVVNVHARMRGFTDPMPLYLSPAYAQAGRILFREWAAAFPADLFARGLASVETVLRLTSATLAYPGYSPVRDKLIQAHPENWPDPYVQFIEPLAPLLLLGALLLIGIRSRMLALASLLILGYFMAYPSLLFQIRHAFHLTFVIPWAILFLLENALTTLACPLSRKAKERFFRRAGSVSLAVRAVAKTALVLAVPLILCVIGLAGLRYWQACGVNRMVAAYRAAEQIPVETETVEEGDLCILKPLRPLPGLEESWNLPVGDSTASYIVLNFARTDTAFPVQLRYKPKRGPDLQHEFVVPAGGDCSYVVPVYEMADFLPRDFLLVKHRFGNAPLSNLLVHSLGTNKFEGISLHKDAAPLLRNIACLKGHNELPWLLYLRLDPDPGKFRACKRLGWEKKVLGLPAEWRYLVGGDPARASREYLELLSEYPDHEPYVDRILSLVSRVGDPEVRADLLFRVGGYCVDRRGWFAARVADIAAEVDASGDPAKAEALYRRAVTLAPADRWHQVHLADVLLKQGDAEQALALYARVLEDAPESPYSAAQFDKVCLDTGRLEYLTQFWTALHQGHPDMVVPALHLAQDYERRELWEEAGSLYERTLQKHDEHPETLLRYGILTAFRHGYTPGRKMMDRALALAPELKSSYITGLDRVAKKLNDTGAVSFSEAIYREIVSLQPDDLQYVVRLAEVLTDKGEPEAAADLYKTILSKAPESPYSAGKLDELLKKTLSGEERIKYWNEVCALQPAASVPRLHLGMALKDAGNLEQAHNAFERAHRNDPNNAVAALQYGASTAVRNARDEGLALIRQAAASEPRLRSEAAKALADIAAKNITEGRPEEAESLYKEAITLDPEELWHAIHLGELYLSQERPDEALALFQQVIEAVPDSPRTSELIDQCYALKQDSAGRAAYWRSVTETHPDAAHPFYHLGLALEAENAQEKAAAAYRQALVINPELENAKKALQKLAPAP